jgi:FkbH-like protein
VVEDVNASSIDRIVQLIGKTNQFKLNPNVFDAGYIEKNADHVIALRLKDRLQDYGIVAIAVTEPRGKTLHISNWVMSCRVFSRRLEHAMAEILWSHAEKLGLGALDLSYVASPKNGIVPGLIGKLGFASQHDEPRFVAHDRNIGEDHHMTIQYPAKVFS